MLGKRTQGSETSKYLEEEKFDNKRFLVAASENGKSLNRCS